MFRYLGQEVRFIATGAGVRDVGRLVALSAAMHLRARVGRALRFGPSGGYLVQLSDGTQLRVRGTDSVLFEVFAFGAYGLDLEFLGDVRTLLDVGANIGCASVYLARRFPSALIGAVEPAPDTFALLEENLARNVSGARAIRAAATAETGVALLSAEPLAHFRHLTSSSEEPAYEVPAMTLAQLIDAFRFEQVDLLKLDVEGSERELLEVAGSWAPRVRCVLAEVHPPLTVAAALRRLVPYGFEARPLPAGELFENLLLAHRRG